MVKQVFREPRLKQGKLFLFRRFAERFSGKNFGGFALVVRREDLFADPFLPTTTANLGTIETGVDARAGTAGTRGFLG